MQYPTTTAHFQYQQGSLCQCKYVPTGSPASTCVPYHLFPRQNPLQYRSDPVTPLLGMLQWLSIPFRVNTQILVGSIHIMRNLPSPTTQTLSLTTHHHHRHRFPLPFFTAPPPSSLFQLHRLPCYSVDTLGILDFRAFGEIVLGYFS